ncbi:MAG: calcium/proton exchanger [Actinomycetota bacterium]|nr:calcium/proton exchanger [Actinomycetota bacterium]
MKLRLDWFLILVPVAVILDLVGVGEVTLFVVSALAIVPLAGVIGRETEDIAAHLGPRAGGLLNATFGNLTEMIVSIFLIANGELEVVKASLTGSIIGNVLLVLGMSFLVGGWSREEQRFSRATAGLYTGSLVIAVIALLMPALFALSPNATHAHTEAVSIGVAVVLIVMYGLSMLFSMKTHKVLFRTDFEKPAEEPSVSGAIVKLLLATIAVAVMSEILVRSLGPTVASLGVSRLFVGLIVVPIIGNAAEHSSAILLAYRDKVETAVEIAIGSSTQIAIFVAPVLVFVSLIAGHPMNFVFSAPEIAAVTAATAVLCFIALDGRANWFEGAELIATYVILAISFYFL